MLSVVAGVVGATVVGARGELGRDVGCMRGLLRSPGITGLVVGALFDVRFRTGLTATSAGD